LKNDLGDTTGVDLAPAARDPRGASHVVQFYENEEFLADVVADFLGPGLSAGDHLMVIARAERHTLFARRLRERGLDPDGARARDQLLWLDARETLAKISSNGQPTRERFLTVVGPVFDRLRAQAPRARVRAYGEMVDLLWNDGNSAAALALEDLWNELQSRHHFSLLCAYTMGNFFTRAGGLTEVCAGHHKVLELELPAAAADSTDLPTQYTRALAAEIRQRKLVEETLRATVRELRGKEEVRDAAALRAERLMRITTAIADAVSGEQVFQAVVDEMAAVLEPPRPGCGWSPRTGRPRTWSARSATRTGGAPR
jgi:hypothetical protein